MKRDPDQYYDSIAVMETLKSRMRRFLQTHTDGVHQMIEWMATVPEDRSVETYRAGVAKEDAEYEYQRALTVVRIYETKARGESGPEPITYRDATMGKDGIE